MPGAQGEQEREIVFHRPVAHPLLALPVVGLQLEDHPGGVLPAACRLEELAVPLAGVLLVLHGGIGHHHRVIVRPEVALEILGKPFRRIRVGHDGAVDVPGDGCPGTVDPDGLHDLFDEAVEGLRLEGHPFRIELFVRLQFLRLRHDTVAPAESLDSCGVEILGFGQVGVILDEDAVELNARSQVAR